MRRGVLILLLAGLLLVGCGKVPADPPETEPLALDFRGASLTVGMAESAMLDALGNDYTCSEAESCAGEGVDRMYTYPSVRIYVFAPREGLATVTSVSYTDDGADTDGVCIGCNVALVEQAFGTPDEQREGALVYRRDGAVLTVTEQGGCVNAVLLTEDE